MSEVLEAVLTGLAVRLTDLKEFVGKRSGRNGPL